MYLLPLTQNQQKCRRNIATQIRNLIDDISRTLYLDMQRLAVMRHFEDDYCRDQFGALSADCVTLNLYCMQFNRKQLDYRTIWDRWLELRNIFAKYLGKNDPNLSQIDREYLQSHLLRTLPEFKYTPRPTKKLRIEWWQGHPNRQQALNNMAQWWGDREAGPISFEDLNVPHPNEIV